MTKKAMAYVSDAILGRTGEVIGRGEQRERIVQYARENDIEVVAWFEDEAFSEDVLARPGVRALVDRIGECECVLVERTWTLTRQWPELRRFLARLDTCNVRLEAATTLWDCVSQMARQHYRKGAAVPRPVERPQVEVTTRPARVSRPLKLHFAGLTRAASHA